MRYKYKKNYNVLLSVFFVFSLMFPVLANSRPLYAETVSYQMAVYEFPGSKKNAKLLAINHLKAKYPQFKIVDKLNDETTEPEIALISVSEVQEKYAPPDMRSIGYFGRGLTREQAEKIQNSDHVLIVNIAYRSDKAWQHHLSIQKFIKEIATTVNGLIWDEETRELFSVAAWEEQRAYDIKKGIPYIQDHTVIHAYKNGDYVRAISLGMGKFGLPDIVVNDLPWSINRNMGSLINVVMQSLAEGLSLSKDKQLTINIDKIKNDKFRTEIKASLKDNAKRIIKIPVRAAKREEGDPYNRILELVFDDTSGKASQERQEELLGELFGWEDSIVYVKHNEKIMSASKAAKEKLPSLELAFNKGLQPGEYIQLKAPFTTPDGGTEWMWVEVITWSDGKIKGLLKNEPFNIPDLQAGVEVEVSQDDIFDYIRYYVDGNIEGNETGKLIEKFSKQK